MSALAPGCLAALLLWAQAAPAPQEPVQARAEAHPRAAEVGQPFVLTVVAEHPAHLGVLLEPGALRADASWVVLDARAGLTLPHPQRAELARTRASWRLASLEPGERALPAVALGIEDPGRGEPRELLVEAGGVSVASLLPEGEAEARPPRDFLPLGAAERSRALGWAFAALLVVLAGAVLLVRRARGRRAPAAAEPSALERLAELEQRPLDEPQAVQEAHFELTRLLRAEVDRCAGAARAGLTDGEWLAAAARELEVPRRSELEALLRASAEVKYGGARPTHWQARENLARARALLVELDKARAREEVAA